MATETATMIVGNKEDKKQSKEKPEKEALYYKELKDNIVQCQLCPRFCTIKPGERGNCGVRQNINGKLYSLVYNKPCSVALDPIEKKPLFHFMPGQEALSIATVGCNLHCLHCQNWTISQAAPEEIPYMYLTPKEVILGAEKKDIKIISYTYTEPTVFYEYMFDIAKIAKKNKIKNTMVTNGFINSEPSNELCKYIDGANVDVKGNEKFYEEVCGAKLGPVLESIKKMHEQGVWLEVTNLIIPGYNDNEKEIMKIVDFVKGISKDIPLHFSAFYPAYKMQRTGPTSKETIKNARETAMKHLNYVYTGNISDEEGSTTFCPKCKKAVIKRNEFYAVVENNIVDGKCKFCNEKIAGIWQ
jgi:pyruvate formate lyase activating enzyme